MFHHAQEPDIQISRAEILHFDNFSSGPRVWLCLGGSPFLIEDPRTLGISISIRFMLKEFCFCSSAEGNFLDISFWTEDWWRFVYTRTGIWCFSESISQTGSYLRMITIWKNRFSIEHWRLYTQLDLHTYIPLEILYNQYVYVLFWLPRKWLYLRLQNSIRSQPPKAADFFGCDFVL